MGIIEQRGLEALREFSRRLKLLALIGDEA
jgi:hypothetical protein